MSKNGEVFRTIVRSSQYSKKEQKKPLVCQRPRCFSFTVSVSFLYFTMCSCFSQKINDTRKLENVFCLQLLEGGEYEGEQDLVPFYSPEDLLSVYPHQFYQVP
jgi:hypothetical protein